MNTRRMNGSGFNRREFAMTVPGLLAACAPESETYEAAVALALHRTALEALTNVRRHE